GRGTGMKLVAAAALIVIAIVLFAFIGRRSKPVSQNSAQYIQQSGAYTSAEGSDLYVKETGRTCAWDSEFEWWVDEKSGCYFYFDDTVSPAQWKYWYEGVSSDYGDYGWMEYDDSKKKWYIETSYQNWQELPKTYNTKNLWHMNNAYEAP
ncbi:MAG: hypothetical protein Q4G47_07490, partial [Lachnospiraceae bacterium]|nr:hypothetical protein [Lachnospiraceae bacterium]